MGQSTHKLPLNITDIECVTECWTYYRLIILKTSPYYEDWLASHYNLFATDNHRFLFGYVRLFAPEYYDAILFRKQIYLFELEEYNVIDTLKKELSDGNYLNMMIRPIKDKDWIHEVLIYGFNDIDKVFHTIGYENRSFKKIDYSYEHILSTLEKVKAHFRKDNQKGMNLSAWHQYPITAFRINDNYCSDNCVFDAYRKLLDELQGAPLDLNQMKAPGEYEVYTKIHKGLSCLDALSDLLHKVLNGEIDDEKAHLVIPALKKLHEHRHMMVITMKYIQKKWHKALFPQTADHISSYEKCYETVGKWLNMSLKYELIGKTEMLQSILSEIPQVAEKEFHCLNELVHNCIDWDKFNENYI